MLDSQCLNQYVWNPSQKVNDRNAGPVEEIAVLLVVTRRHHDTVSGGPIKCVRRWRNSLRTAGLRGEAEGIGSRAH